MKVFILVALFAGALAHSRLDDDNYGEENIRDTNTRKEFGAFIRKFKKSEHLRSGEDVKRRFSIFSENVKGIKDHNKKKSSYRQEVNKFSDLTLHERVQFTGLTNISNVNLQRRNMAVTRRDMADVADAPDAYDHRDDGHVSEVTNQGDCGSCWTYGTVYPLEGELSILSGKDAVGLSQQEILSCAYESEADKNGCQGGWYMDGWEYVQKSGRLATAADEPYLGVDMNCDPDINEKPNAFEKYNVYGWKQVPSKDDAALAMFGSKHVIAVAVESFGLFFYEGGIFLDDLCETPALVNHAVTMVGYTTEAWIIKNSWGEDWGEKGYVRMSRAMNSHCGVSDYAFFPLVEEKIFNDDKDEDEDETEEATEEDECHDAKSAKFCAKRKSKGYCTNEKEMKKMKKNCAKTCDLCDA